MSKATSTTPQKRISITTHESGVAILRPLVENLDGGNAPRIMREVEEAEVGRKMLVLDFSHVRFLDSAGLSFVSRIQSSSTKLVCIHADGRTVRCLKKLPRNRQPLITSNLEEAMRILSGNKYVTAGTPITKGEPTTSIVQQ